MIAARQRLVLLVLGVSAVVCGAQAETVYKWVDENGVPHYSNSLPEGITNYEVLGVEPAPAIPAEAVTAPPPVQPGAQVAPAPEKPTETPASPGQPDPSRMSLTDLDARCEAAREELIAPLREAEIQRCQANPENDPAWCQRYFADYGDAARRPDGVMGPRLFDDLPECAQAQAERERRGSNSR